MIVRMRYSIVGRVRFVGHRDMTRVWERVLRRLGLPVVMTAGFTPRPRISFGLALPVGAESIAEYLDVVIDDGHGLPEDLDAWCEEISAATPDGVAVTVVAPIEAGNGSLQEIVTTTTWELWSPQVGPDEIDSACRLMERQSVMIERERKGRRSTDDIRPAITALTKSDGPTPSLIADLSTLGRALRPAELAAVAFPRHDPDDVRVRRLSQWIDHGGQRREVLPRPCHLIAPGHGRPGKEFPDERPQHTPRAADWPPGADRRRSGGDGPWIGSDARFERATP